MLGRAFLVQNIIPSGSLAGVWSARTGSGERLDMLLRHDQAPDRAGIGFHTSLSGSFDLAASGTHHYHQNRTTLNLNELWLDGVFDSQRTTTATVIPENPLGFSGRVNLLTLLDADYSFMSVGGSLTDPVAHHTNVMNLLTSIGAI